MRPVPLSPQSARLRTVALRIDSLHPKVYASAYFLYMSVLSRQIFSVLAATYSTNLVHIRFTRDGLARVADFEHEIAHQLIENVGILEVDRMPASGDRSPPRVRQCRRKRADDLGLDQRILLADHAQNRHREPLSDCGEIVALGKYPRARIGGRTRAVNADFIVKERELRTAQKIIGGIG